MDVKNLWKVVKRTRSKKEHGGGGGGKEESSGLLTCSSRRSSFGSILIPANMEVYSYDDVKSMTNDFSKDNLLGTSTSTSSGAKFYQGCLPSETHTRTRTIKIWTFDSTDWAARNACVTSLMDEIAFLSSSEGSHACLPKMIGCCWDYNSLAAVYDVNPLGTLHKLINQEGIGSLNWSDRVQIAYKCALLLQYLHGLKPCLLAHDLSTHHIVLDQDKNPFYILLDGLLLDKQRSIHVSDSSVPPSSGSSSDSDVHSFGILLLALLDTKGCERTRFGECNFDEHTWEQIYKIKAGIYSFFCESVELVDKRYKGHHHHNSYDVHRLSKLAVRCLSQLHRPTMGIVIERIQALFLFSINERGVLPLKDSCLGELTFQELSTITDDFSTDNLIGKTLYGSLYRGKIVEGWKGCKAQEVTVKILEKTKTRRVGDKDLVYKLKDEMSFLRHPRCLSHPCLPRMIGFCYENQQLGVVYKLKTVGTLKDFLSKDTFEWAHRIEMINQLSSLLHFLHAYDPPYIIGNLSTCHLLIDEGMRPILIDFGMMTGGILGSKKEEKHLHNLGSTGYIDAYSIYVLGQWTPKIDVYAFGVILIELISKKHVLDGKEGCASIVCNFQDYFVDYLKAKTLSDYVDPTLKKQDGYSDGDANEIIKMALHSLCIHPPARPSVDDINLVLERLKFFSV